jgi:hypothetical protein
MFKMESLRTDRISIEFGSGYVRVLQASLSGEFLVRIRPLHLI